MITPVRVTDMYMSVLSSLSNDEKLDWIAKLSDFMREKITQIGLERCPCRICRKMHRLKNEYLRIKI